MTIAKATRIRALLCFHPCDLLSFLSLFSSTFTIVDGPKDQKRSIREEDSLNVRFVILYTGYYVRDDGNFSCLNFEIRLEIRSLRYYI